MDHFKVEQENGGREMRRYLCALGAITFIMSPVQAQVLDANTGHPIPGARACRATHALGQEVWVRQRVGPSQHWAHASRDPDGWPAITYGSVYFQLPPLMKVFTSAHECGHLVLGTWNEFHANCFALDVLNLSPGERKAIADFHRSIGQIGPQYGGSGANFWNMTAQACPHLAKY
jgi:hypothetical protein